MAAAGSLLFGLWHIATSFGLTSSNVGFTRLFGGDYRIEAGAHVDRMSGDLVARPSANLSERAYQALLPTMFPRYSVTNCTTQSYATGTLTCDLPTGPYAITSVDEHAGIVLDRNPEWDPATDDVRTALPDKVVVRTGLPGREFSSQAIVLLDANGDKKLDIVSVLEDGTVAGDASE